MPSREGRNRPLTNGPNDDDDDEEWEEGELDELRHEEPMPSVWCQHCVDAALVISGLAFILYCLWIHDLLFVDIVTTSCVWKAHVLAGVPLPDPPPGAGWTYPWGTYDDASEVKLRVWFHEPGTDEFAHLDKTLDYYARRLPLPGTPEEFKCRYAPLEEAVYTPGEGWVTTIPRYVSVLPRHVDRIREKFRGHLGAELDRMMNRLTAVLMPEETLPPPFTVPTAPVFEKLDAYHTLAGELLGASFIPYHDKENNVIYRAEEQVIGVGRSNDDGAHPPLPGKREEFDFLGVDK